MYNIRLTPYRQRLGTLYHRQTPGHTLTTADGRYRFWLGNEPDMPDPDFWVVQGKGVRQGETCRVAPQNTILLTTEPRSVLVYPRRYLDQFGMVCTCQEQTRHRNVRFGPPILPWFVGYSEAADGTLLSTSLDYDTLSAQPAPKKEKMLSVITSSKAFTQGHIDRLRFVKVLKQHYGDQIDVFGHGFHDFADKWDVLAPYRYHIVIENSSQPYYWTEKMSDCLLAHTFPLYYGCTNMADYIPRQAFEPIDIRRPEEAISIIDQAMAQDHYTQASESLDEARRLMLDTYNMFPFIASLCDQLDPTLPKQSVTIKPCRSSQHPVNLWRYTVARKYYETKASLMGLK